MRILFLCFLLTGCSLASMPELKEPAASVQMVDVITITDLQTYERVAELRSVGMRSVEYCRNDLRNQAANLGATVIRMSPAQPDTCAEDILGNGARNCFSASADAYRPKKKN